VARIASLIREPARTAMLLPRMDGRGLTAKNLARAAGKLTTTPHAASMLRQHPHQRTTCA